MKKAIDHLVYCVPNLREGIQIIEEKFGIAPVYGGRHLTRGTHNALLNLGDGCYLELLAVDPKNDSIPPPRWMGVDLIKTSKLTRWSIKSIDFERELSILTKANSELGKAFAGSRKTSEGSLLNWKMSLPLSSPEVEILPFVLDWKDSIHPTENLPKECRLIELSATHSNPEIFQKTLEDLGGQLKIKRSEVSSLVAKIKTPNGIIEI